MQRPYDLRISARAKPLVALRWFYKGGYRYYFDKHLLSLFEKGYTAAEIGTVCTDKEMLEWIQQFFDKHPEVVRKLFEVKAEAQT